MKRIAGTALLILALVAIALPGPVAASQRYYWTGTVDQQIDVLGNCNGETSYAANTAFWVAHGYFIPGWSTLTLEEMRGEMLPTTYFELRINGEVQPSAMLALYVPQLDLKVKIFPAGFDQGFPTGQYDFVGTWYEDGSLVGGTFGTAVVDRVCNVAVTFS